MLTKSKLFATSNRTNVKLGLLSLLFFLIIKFILSHAVLSSFSGLYLTLELDKKDRVIVYFAGGDRALFSENRAKRSKEIPAGKKITTGIPLNGHLARKLRIDPGDQSTQIKLYALALESDYGPPLHLEAEQIFQRFKPNESIASYRLEQDHILIEVSGADPQLVLQDELMVENQFISLFFPFILSFVFYLLLSSFRWHQFPAIADLSRDLSSTHINYAALDGVRGIAVLLVLADHTLPAFTGAGTAGVWIFFVLSGFLLTIPFVDHPERAVSVSYMREYLIRRLKRIIPMYYVYIIVVFFLHGKYSSGAVRHLLFLQGDGHLWTIQQEMLFYLVLPLIVAINFLIFRGRTAWIVAALAILMIAANIWLDRSVISMHGIPTDHRTFAGIFICGMLFSYLYHGGLLHSKMKWIQTREFKFYASILGVFLLLGFILLGTDTLTKPGYYPAHRAPGQFGIAAGIIILLALMTSGGFFSKLLSYTPLRAIGLVGYSFYLIHPVIISLVGGMWEHYMGYRMGLEMRFILVLIVTYVFSAFTYTYIERPFLKRAS